MIPLFEMMKEAGGGDAVQRMARQYGIDTDSMERALETLMPAFSEGLKRNASDPAGFVKFMNALSDGHHARYFQQPEAAMKSSGIEEGNAILGHLFGSKDVSRAVAGQAAQLTGLSQDLLKRMLPALAPMIMGGLFEQMAKTSPSRRADRADPAANPLGWMLEQMSAGGDNPWSEMAERMMGRTSDRRQAPENPFGRMFEDFMGGKPTAGTGNPMGRVFEEMLRQTGGNPERPQTRQEPAEPDKQREPGLEDLFGQMFEAGRKVQNDYQRQMESVFDQFLGPRTKR